ncbi:MAG: 2-oxoacid:acceptor oxidoreductase subunit alpha [Candidatus Micrarchaeaceae archaeon]
MPMEDIKVRIAGDNGDGIESAGTLLARIFMEQGLYIFGYRSFQSVVRGGSVWYQVRASKSKLYSVSDAADILVALNIGALGNNINSVSKGGIVIYDSEIKNPEQVLSLRTDISSISMPLTDMALKAGGSFIYKNTVAIGFICKMLNISEDSIAAGISGEFKGKDAAIKSNIAAAHSGYIFDGGKGISLGFDPNGSASDNYLLNGNTALAIGAYAAGCRFYAAYPMTPASSILYWFADHEPLGVVYKQTEDEIAAINMTIGAASAGVRAMCGTSGGGFSLMVEALGMAGMLEVPIVVVDAQRSGPSTGLPTKTEQGDLLFVTHASQGDFPRIVLAPTSVEECFYLGAEAFNLAERYQCPVIVLLDLYISEHIESANVDPSKIKIYKEERADASKISGKFKRYEITETGVSKRSVPGEKGLEFVASSDEHNEYGELISDVFAGISEYVALRKKMHEKRMRKLDTMLKDGSILAPQVINPGAEIFIVTFGSSTGASIEAANQLKSKGVNAGVIAFSYLYPMESEKIKALLSGKKLVDVECNYSAQLAKLIEMHTGIEIKHKFLKYDGEPISSREIVDAVYNASKMV